MNLSEPSTLILAADVGGTNLNMGLLAHEQGELRLLRSRKVPTRTQASLSAALMGFLQEGGERPVAAGISSAAPVTAEVIQLTNTPFAIDRPALVRDLGVPVRVVNDFLAVSLGVAALAPEDRTQLAPLPCLDGRAAAIDPEGTALVVGAGTGLGVGFVTRDRHGLRAHPSEGGHVGLPILDDLGIELWRHLASRFPGPPGAEAAVSGPGIANLLDFLCATGRSVETPELTRILALPAEDQPGAIAEAAPADPTCARAMDLFVRLYARVCADLAAVFLPTGGLFLAGGIAAKNLDRFLEGDRFMRAFQRNYRTHIDAITAATPVHVVLDYDVSLFGAARAALEPRP